MEIKDTENGLEKEDEIQRVIKDREVTKETGKKIANTKY